MPPYQLCHLGTPKRQPAVNIVDITETIGFYPATCNLSSKLKYLQIFSLFPLYSTSFTFLPSTYLFNDLALSFSKKNTSTQQF